MCAHRKMLMLSKIREINIIMLVLGCFDIYRPLPDEFIRYARTDTHYLLYIYDCMKNDLLHRVGGRKNLVMSVFSASTLLCAKV